ncbi:MAG TPA: phage Gp37/Gp68 family protein [Marinilabiliaceae bacterium]|nr:phage Gp37/Gp68 family protein [Marinilabiliaceae bacterium]
MAQSSIEWTELTWNPTTGCDKVSQGCKNCYAERMAKRLNAMGVEKYRNTFKITEHPESLNEPYRWKKRKIVFVNSMSDLFHEKVSDEFILKVFEVMKDTEHVYQILTKRAERLLDFDKNVLKGRWPYNVWMGVSVEDKRVLDRIDYLRQTGAQVKFLSCEPLIGPLENMNLENIHWAIVGGESGPKSREMKSEWVLDIKDQCEKADVRFFFKQWGGTNKKKAGRKINGKTYDDMPDMEGVLADAGVTK